MKVSVFRVALLAGAALAIPAFAQSSSPPPYQGMPADPLADGFRSPPDSARPRVWWHWMNGNVTEDGIVRDLDWMKRVGIGGVQTFDASLATPQVVKERLVYMTPAWQHAFGLSVTKARDLGLEYAVPAAPGWSETGGPWVPPEDGMKKLAWSITRVSGASRGPIRLAVPPDTTGPFQTMPNADEGPANGKPLPTLYRDVRVLAFRQSSVAPPRIVTATNDSGAVDAAKLADGDIVSPIQLAKAGAASGWVRLDYGKPVSVRSASIAWPAEHDALSAIGVKLEASDDGTAFRPVAEDAGVAFAHTTLAFAPVTARYFRITLTHHPVSRNDLIQGAQPGFTLDGLGFGGGAKPLAITEAALSDMSTINQFEEKAGFATTENYNPLDTPAAVGGGIDPKGVLDLTDKLRPDGTLDWRPPAGNWIVYRFGWTLTGTQNHPATAEATGLEVDKLDPAAVKRYIDTYLNKIAGAAGKDGLGPAGIGALVNDSTETGPQNWTGDMIAQFEKRRGYDPAPWLPALAGVIVGDPAKSDAFLSDYRRTLGELLADAHYQGMALAAHAHGMIHYSEAMEFGRPTFGDDMAMRRFADVPMAAMWSYRLNQQPAAVYLADDEGAASTAHVYGKKLVAAESMTSALAPWSFAPFELKRVIDREFIAGINLPVIHDSAHQPTEDAPGMSLSLFGQFFNRHETWAEQGRPWIDYIARTAFLLQRGRFAADIAYFYGEDAPLTAIYKDHSVSDIPTGHGFDFVGADAIGNQLSVNDGALTTPSGMRYRVLQLAGGDARMTLPTLRHIRDLVKAGAIVAGPKPLASPSLADPVGEFDAIVSALWDGAEGRNHVFATADAALNAVGAGKDLDAPGVNFVHRILSDGDLYFLSNPGEARDIDLNFRVAGKQPELWHAETGAREATSWHGAGGRTIVPLHMAANDAVFVMFRKATDATSQTVEAPVRHDLATIDDGWTLSFQPGRGAPARAVSTATGSWAASPDPGIRYFSGTGTYTRAIDVPAGWLAKGQTLWIDLGGVGDLAEVLVNGQSARIAWHAPFAAEIGGLLHQGKNTIEVRVTDLWTNRLIGDVQPGATKIAKVYIPTFRADAPLRPAGLLGPVRLYVEKEAKP